MHMEYLNVNFTFSHKNWTCTVDSNYCKEGSGANIHTRTQTEQTIQNKKPMKQLFSKIADNINNPK